MVVYRVNDWEVSEEGNLYIIKNTTHPGWYNEYDRLTGRYLYIRKRVPKRVDMFIKGHTGVTRRPVNRTFGVEIECYHPTNTDIRRDIAEALTRAGIPTESQGYNHNVIATWKVVTDSSIHGGTCAEVVSPVLSGTEGLVQLREVMKVLSNLGCRVNRSTGMHTHIGANDLNETELHRVFEFYRLNEGHFDSLVAASRRHGNSYCESLRNYENEFPRTRYTKVNYQAYLKYGTVEFRQHQGTLNGEKATHWVNLMIKVVEHARTTEPTAYSTLEEMLEALGTTDTNWYLERAEELAA